MIDWATEKPLIEAECAKKNVEAAFIMAIREAENGGDGKQFGVLSTNAPTYADQLRICVATVAHRLESYPSNPLQRDPFGKLRYRDNWIAYFQSIWSPVGVDNDPNGLNKNWLHNVGVFYEKHRGSHF